MKIGGSKYITFDYGICNYLRFSFYSPYLYLESDVYKKYSEEQRSAGIQAPTLISFDSSAHHWSFSFLILGFGFGITRQWSY